MKILFVVEADIATTQLLERLLVAAKKFGVTYKKVYLSQLKLGDFSGSLVPLFVRCGSPDLLNWLKFLGNLSIPYIYYIDDNFWEIKGKSALALYYQNKAVRSTLEFAVKQADLVLTNSANLSSYLHRFNSRQVILDGFFDFSLLPVGVERQQFAPNEIRIGFAGSPSRQDDFLSILGVVERVLERNPNVVLELIGIKPDLKARSGQVRYFPHLNNYEEYLSFQVGRCWHIGLAPLLDTEANRSKTNNKFREYGAMGIASVYQAMPPYTDSVVHLVTGLLAKTETDWETSINHFVSTPASRDSIALAAKEYVFTRYEVNHVAEEWVDAISQAGSRVSGSHLGYLIAVLVLKTKAPFLLLKKNFTLIALEYSSAGLKSTAVKIYEVFKRRLQRTWLSKIIQEVIDTKRKFGWNVVVIKILKRAANFLRSR